MRMRKLHTRQTCRNLYFYAFVSDIQMVLCAPRILENTLLRGKQQQDVSHGIFVRMVCQRFALEFTYMTNVHMRASAYESVIFGTAKQRLILH